MKKIPTSLLILCLLISKAAFSQAPKYIKVPLGYLMVLSPGDSLFTELEKLTVAEKIPSASITGMGFVNLELGYFNSVEKKYDSRTFKDMELASLLGTIAWQNGKPSLHLHGVGADKHFKVKAGHVLSAVVSTGTLEITVLVHDKRLERVKDKVLGANVLELKD